MLQPVDFPQILYPNSVNANRSILSFYARQIVPRITKRSTIQLAAFKRAKGIIGDEEYEDDGNYGSAATLDVEVLQAISKRVHYGAFPSQKKRFVKLTQSHDLCLPNGLRPRVQQNHRDTAIYLLISCALLAPREIRLGVQVCLGSRGLHPAHPEP